MFLSQNNVNELELYNLEENKLTNSHESARFRSCQLLTWPANLLLSSLRAGVRQGGTFIIF